MANSFYGSCDRLEPQRMEDARQEMLQETERRGSEQNALEILDFDDSQDTLSKSFSCGQ